MNVHSFFAEDPADLDTPPPPPVRTPTRPFLVTRLDNGKIRTVHGTSFADVARQFNKTKFRIRIQPKK